MKIIFIFLVSLSFLTNAQKKDFTFVFLNKKPDAVELPAKALDQLMKAHLSNIQQLVKEGKLVVAGPFEGGGGILIFNSTSVSEVKSWLFTDPGVQASRWNIEIFPYHARLGSACVVSEPYEMVSYEFIRYTTNMTKYNVQQAPETARKHDEYIKEIIKTGNAIAEGTFGDDGGILIMKGDLQKEVIEADPSQSEGLFQIEFKKLFIARGAFCEK